VATRLIEGGSSAERLTARLAAFRGEAWLDDLIDLLVRASVDQCRSSTAGLAICRTACGSDLNEVCW
jgi:hypothetical protein